MPDEETPHESKVTITIECPHGTKVITVNRAMDVLFAEIQGGQGQPLDNLMQTLLPESFPKHLTLFFEAFQDENHDYFKIEDDREQSDQ